MFLTTERVPGVYDAGAVSCRKLSKRMKNLGERTPGEFWRTQRTAGRRKEPHLLLLFPLKMDAYSISIDLALWAQGAEPHFPSRCT